MGKQQQKSFRNKAVYNQIICKNNEKIRRKTSDGTGLEIASTATRSKVRRYHESHIQKYTMRLHITIKAITLVCGKLGPRSSCESQYAIH